MMVKKDGYSKQTEIGTSVAFAAFVLTLMQLIRTVGLVARLKMRY